MVVVLLGLFVRRMRSTKSAVFLERQLARSSSLVLRRRIIPALALAASQCDNNSHALIPSYRVSGIIQYPVSNTLHPAPPTGASSTYSSISLITPAPTVRPPSRMANLSSFSMAMGVINSACIPTLSPGITISVPSGSVTTPVTSVVLK